MKKTLNKGFTLIELLVVIAIIGILASVILASLNSARAKGTDAATKSDLDNARAQAELYYDGNSTSGNSYASVCTTAGSSNGVKDMMADAGSKIGGTYSADINSTTSATLVVCHDQAQGWAASTPLKATPGSYFCVDSSGASKTTTTPLSGGQILCS